MPSRSELINEGLKDCGRCKAIYPLSYFNKDKHNSYGYRSQCKGCMKEERRANREYYKNYRDSPEVMERMRKYRKENYDPKKMRARNLTRKLERKPCESCGSELNIEAHHDDYDKPLEVRWLCAPCHKQWHAKHGEAKNAA